MKAREDGRRRGVSQARKAPVDEPWKASWTAAYGGVLDLPQEETTSRSVNRPHTHPVVRRRHGDDGNMGLSMRVVVGACFLFVGVVRSDEAPRLFAQQRAGASPLRSVARCASAARAAVAPRTRHGRPRRATARTADRGPLSRRSETLPGPAGTGRGRGTGTGLTRVFRAGSGGGRFGWWSCPRGSRPRRRGGSGRGR